MIETRAELPEEANEPVADAHVELAESAATQLEATAAGKTGEVHVDLADSDDLSVATRGPSSGALEQELSETPRYLAAGSFVTASTLAPQVTSEPPVSMNGTRKVEAAKKRPPSSGARGTSKDLERQNSRVTEIVEPPKAAAEGGDEGGGNERPRIAEGGEDPELPRVNIERMLGFPAEQLDVVDPPEGGFSERQQILEDTRNKIIAARDKQVEKLKSHHGIELTGDQIRDWKPTKADEKQLRKELRAERVRAQMCQGLEKAIQDPRVTEKMFPQQQDALVATQRFIEEAPRDTGGGKSGDVDMPTGTGKTGTFVTTIAALKSEEDPKDPIRVLVVEPTKQLVLQTVGSLDDSKENRTGFAKFAPDLEVGAFYQDEHSLHTPITVITNASFNKLVQEGSLGHYDVVVVDEAHTDLGDNISRTVRRYKPGRLFLAYTATREFHAEKTVGDIMTHKIFSLPLTEAIYAGRLAPVSAYNREFSLTFDEELLPTDPKERAFAIETAYFDEALRLSMQDIIEAAKEGVPMLIRCPPGPAEDVPQGVRRKTHEKAPFYAARAQQRIQERLITTLDRTYQGRIKILPVGGDQTTKEQQLILQTFRRGQAHGLSYVSVINMGTDVPDAKRLIDLNVRTRSRVDKVQALGRILRPTFNNRGEPVRAVAIDYRVPEIGDTYSFRDALGLRPGEVTVQAKYQYKPHEKPAPIVLMNADVLVQEGGTSVTHLGQKGDHPLRFDSSESLSFETACEVFGIDPDFMSRCLREVGYSERPQLAAYQYVTLAKMIKEHWFSEDQT